jgi:TrmH family RNA methyltransferase
VALADRPRGSSVTRLRTKPLVVVAIDVQDPGNLGAMVRVAEAGGATGVVVTGQSADPFGWKALRGSSGSALRLPIDVIADTGRALEEIRSRGCRVIATVPRDGRSFFDLDYTGPTAILIGAEGRGLPAPLVSAADERVTIPMQSPVESLNAAVAAALIVYEARRQRVERPLAATSPSHR